MYTEKTLKKTLSMFTVSERNLRHAFQNSWRHFRQSELICKHRKYYVSIYSFNNNQYPLFKTYLICLKHTLLCLSSRIYTYLLIVYILLVHKIIYKWPDLYIKT